LSLLSPLFICLFDSLLFFPFSFIFQIYSARYSKFYYFSMYFLIYNYIINYCYYLYTFSFSIFCNRLILFFFLQPLQNFAIIHHFIFILSFYFLLSLFLFFISIPLNSFILRLKSSPTIISLFPSFQYSIHFFFQTISYFISSHYKSSKLLILLFNIRFDHFFPFSLYQVKVFSSKTFSSLFLICYNCII